MTGPTRDLASAYGINAYNQGVLHPTVNNGGKLPGVDIEPPDQGLCAGNGLVMEVNNMVMQVFNASTMNPVVRNSNGMALERLFDAPEVFGATGGNSYNVQGDPRCYYDPASRHWFASELWLDEHDATARNWSGTTVAVSTTSSPLGAWHVYFVPDQTDKKGVDGCNDTPPAVPYTAAHPTTFALGTANPCFGDQPLLGVNANTVSISTNEYPLLTSTGPGGAANVYFLSKSDLINDTPSPIYWAHLGDTVGRLGSTRLAGFGFPNTTCPSLNCPWYSIVPAVSDGAYVTGNGGTFYALSTDTFTTSGATKMAEWVFTNTDVVTGRSGHITGAVQVATTVAYSEPSLAVQRQGPHPLGTLWAQIHGLSSFTPPFGPEGPIQTNTDRVTTAAYDPATGALWGAVNSGVTVWGQKETGIAWGSMKPRGSGAALAATTVRSGYLAIGGGNDVMYPSITFTNSGQGLMDYAISGVDYYPGTAYSLIGWNGPSGFVHLASQGIGPADGFTEYTPTYHRPRWGDYSTALATGTTFYFASEKVNQSCTTRQFARTFTCGGTRDLFANWGTSVNKLPAGYSRQY